MSKVLITSLGNGRWDSAKKKHEYLPVKYSLDGKTAESAYIYDALLQTRGYDKVIFVGTAGSNWGLLYEYLCDKHGVEPDFEYMLSLESLYTDSDKRRRDPGEIRTQLEPLKQAMGEVCADIIVLKYGLDDAELLTNFELMTKIAENISDGDSLTFDITHSFRSLAVFELLAVSYIKDTLGKNITLDFVSYGMLEIINENGGVAPIVDLSQLVHMLDWLKAAEEYNRYGTTRLLAELLERDNLGFGLSKEETKVLKRLGGDAIATHDLPEFVNLIKNCRNAVKAVNGVVSRNVVLDFIISDMATRFGNKLNDEMELQAELAKWHFEHKRYIAAAITLLEALKDFIANLANIKKDMVTDKIKAMDCSGKSEIGNFRRQYDDIRGYRNKLAHAEPLSGQDLEELEDYIKRFYSTYTRRFKGNPQNRQDLKRCIDSADVTAGFTSW